MKKFQKNSLFQISLLIVIVFCCSSSIGDAYPWKRNVVKKDLINPTLVKVDNEIENEEYDVNEQYRDDEEKENDLEDYSRPVKWLNHWEDEKEMSNGEMELSWPARQVHVDQRIDVNVEALKSAINNESQSITRVNESKGMVYLKWGIPLVVISTLVVIVSIGVYLTIRQDKS